MIFSNMLMQCLLLPKALSAITASKPLFSLMDRLMTFKSRASHEALTTSFLGTYMFPLQSMNSFDVLFQMLIFNVILIAVIVGTFKWSRIGVGIEVVSQPGGTVEGFGTSRPCAGKSFEI